MLGKEAGGGSGADLVKPQISQGFDFVLRQGKAGKGEGEALAGLSR